ncbi:hypothetical protein ABH908_004665 [Pseudomonas frederiksbergensis]|jgi:hypothetical protein|uniref:hypothetical protein n=1 Tax=Pseudomonas TaxID=286 RepID=UPI00110ED5AF|nr:MULTISPECIES: hypothetical protein [unclassified Pseudomonas]MBD9618842.1 hypothetical protein [Pseudomonas sp. PDM07]QDV96822.1 hypothetical protein FFH90_022025 [Pseudomonas sp. ATCC 43928]CAH0191341.1 hypothetical protein SRABI130_01765 [Pseudomonas sp. Bi130]
MFKRRKRIALDDPSLERVKLTPQMLTYDQFASRSRSQYLPYVMGFNAADYRSEAINTDRLGFRLAYDAQGRPVSVGTLEASTLAEVNLLVGASSALGYGASSDAASVASRLSTHDPDATPWLNFAGHTFNATQELMLFVLHAHRLPKVRRIVIMGGFNTLVMARLPEFIRGDLPPFYFCGDYYEKFDEIAEENGAELPPGKLPKWPAETTEVPPVSQTLVRALQDTMNCLTTWKRLADSLGAELTFVLQPLATWVRTPCAEEQKLFNELDQISRFGTWQHLYGDISAPTVAEYYADSLANSCHDLGVRFASLIDDFRERPDDEWLYVDRAHFTDLGSDVVARAIHRYLQ